MEARLCLGAKCPAFEPEIVGEGDPDWFACVCTRLGEKMRLAGVVVVGNGCPVREAPDGMLDQLMEELK